MSNRTLYNGRDPRELPAYSVADAARFLDVPPATIRSWVAGRTYPRQDGVGSFERIITPADDRTNRLSFYNLVEAHVLRALRTTHSVPLRHIRPAIAYAEESLGIRRLLLSQELYTLGSDLFIEHLGHLISLSRSGQIYVKELLRAYLRRVERDNHAIPIRLYPFVSLASAPDAKDVVIDPLVSFGRPTVSGSGVLTSILVQRIDAGESIEDLEEDYGLSGEQINAAVLFERAA